ncbi:hypothetical protein JCM33374_g1923 [Metschnikowia sp. JCM 33374]|nr:hypothetical protein JCM33374_g1923 [Metschnikowia sp. JCM 33374]
MYTFSAPQHFVDNTDLDFESEWNTQYEPSSSESNSPLFFGDEPESPSSELLYECSFCMSSHSPSSPCEHGHHYTLQLPSSAAYSYREQQPLYVEEKSSQNTFLESNYRKWLVSVTPR